MSIQGCEQGTGIRATLYFPVVADVVDLFSSLNSHQKFSSQPPKLF